MKVVISKVEVKMLMKKVNELKSGMLSAFIGNAVLSVKTDEDIFNQMVVNCYKFEKNALGMRVSHTDEELTLELIPEFMCDLMEIYGSMVVALFGLSIQANSQFKMLEEKWKKQGK